MVNTDVTVNNLNDSRKVLNMANKPSRDDPQSYRQVYTQLRGSLMNLQKGNFENQKQRKKLEQRAIIRARQLKEMSKQMNNNDMNSSSKSTIDKLRSRFSFDQSKRDKARERARKRKQKLAKKYKKAQKRYNSKNKSNKSSSSNKNADTNESFFDELEDATTIFEDEGSTNNINDNNNNIDDNDDILDDIEDDLDGLVGSNNNSMSDDVLDFDDIFEDGDGDIMDDIFDEEDDLF